MDTQNEYISVRRILIGVSLWLDLELDIDQLDEVLKEL